MQLVGAAVRHDVGPGSAISYLQGAYLGETNQLTLAMLFVPGCVNGRPPPSGQNPTYLHVTYLQAEIDQLKAEKTETIVVFV